MRKNTMSDEKRSWLMKAKKICNDYDGVINAMLYANLSETKACRDHVLLDYLISIIFMSTVKLI